MAGVRFGRLNIKVLERLRGTGIALADPALEQAVNDSNQVRGGLWGKLAGARHCQRHGTMQAEPDLLAIDGFRANLVEQRIEAGTTEQLQGEETEAVEIAGGADPSEFWIELLRRKVLAGAGSTGWIFPQGEAGCVAKFDPAAFVQQHVGRLEGPMAFALFVQALQPLQGLAQNVADLSRIEFSLAEARAESTRHEFHDDPAALPVDGVDFDQVVVGQAR